MSGRSSLNVCPRAALLMRYEGLLPYQKLAAGKRHDDLDKHDDVRSSDYQTPS